MLVQVPGDEIKTETHHYNVKIKTLNLYVKVKNLASGIKCLKIVKLYDMYKTEICS